MINKIYKDEYKIVARLALELWKENNLEDLEKEYQKLLSSDKAAIFVYYDENVPIGFAQCQLRYDYVEGTETSPVAYLEGIYVKEKYRSKGIGKELIVKCEEWAKEIKCQEMASDCEITNDISFNFHLNCGFEETNRVICFTKKIK